MAPTRRERRSDCPTAFALDLFGDRWTLLIIRDLMFKGRRRYAEFQHAGEGIATNVLADRLARLEQSGVIASRKDSKDSRTKLYSLTPKGIDLAPLMIEMIVWSAKYDPETAASKDFVRRARRDRVGLIAEIKASHKSDREP